MSAPSKQPDKPAQTSDLALRRALGSTSRRGIERSLAIAALAAMFLLLAALAIGCKLSPDSPAAYHPLLSEQR